MALSIRRSDLFPVGTVVKAYPANAHHRGGRPAGASTAEATVETNGTLTYSSLAEGQWVLWALVGGSDAILRTATVVYTALGTLRQRLAAKRAEVGA